MKNNNIFEYLPTNERREFADQLQSYVDHLQTQIDSIEHRTAIDRVVDRFRGRKKGAQQNSLQNDVTKYNELYTKIQTRLSEEYENWACIAEDAGFEKIRYSGTVDVAGAAACGGLPTGVGMLPAIGMSILNDLGGYSEKAQIAIYRQLLAAAVDLLYQSNVPEEEIRRALFATMRKVGEIKEKYSYITDDDLLAQKIQDECVVEVTGIVERTSDYDKFRQHIEQTIGISAWNKMTQNTQIFLISAELLYCQWEHYGDDIDFAPICMSASKALEVEVTRRYFTRYLDYLEEHCEDVPDALLVRDGSSYRPKCEEEFMLGDITGVTGYAAYLDTQTVKLIGRLTEENRQFLKYAKSELFSKKSEADCIELVKRHVYSVKKVRVQYRNPSAHKQKVAKVSARECLDYMIDIKKALGKLLDDCDW